jgi:hypothetical protein
MPRVRHMRPFSSDESPHAYFDAHFDVYFDLHFPPQAIGGWGGGLELAAFSALKNANVEVYERRPSGEEMHTEEMHNDETHYDEMHTECTPRRCTLRRCTLRRCALTRCMMIRCVLMRWRIVSGTCTHARIALNTLTRSLVYSLKPSSHTHYS